MKFLVLEGQESYDDTDQSYSNSIGTKYSFGENFYLLSIGSTNMYDRHARELCDLGHVDFLADGRNLEGVKDSLLWLDEITFKPK